MVEKGEVVVGDAAHGKLHGVVGKVVDVGVRDRELDFVQRDFTIKVGGEIDFKDGNDRGSGWRGVWTGEAHPCVNDGMDLELKLGQRSKVLREILMAGQGSDAGDAQGR